MTREAARPEDDTTEPDGADRLDSWKDVATYLKRDVSTVQRWERREGLPIYRQQHDKLGSVYAFRHEIDAWRTTRSVLLPRMRSEKLSCPRVAITMRSTSSAAAACVMRSQTGPV